MKVKNLSSLAVDHTTGDTDTTAIWLTQWLAPSTSDPTGGKNFFAYMESTNGGAPSFWDGQNAYSTEGGGVAFTYPGVNNITTSGATGYDPSTGTITIDVPVADVAESGAIDDHLYSVTSSAMTVPSPAENPPPDPILGSGGQLFNLFDSAAGYDYVPAVLKVVGDARTIYSPGKLVRVDVDAVAQDQSAGAAPTGYVDNYNDTRADPPGPATGPVLCHTTAPPTSLTQMASKSVRVDGTIDCSGGLSTGTYSFALTVTNNGPNPPNQDAYHMTLRDATGASVYEWGDLTTVGRGELTVAIHLV
jgi:hypothetical protein